MKKEIAKRIHAVKIKEIAICSLSRTKAAEIISSGAAELDYECEERCDRSVSEGDVA